MLLKLKIGRRFDWSVRHLRMFDRWTMHLDDSQTCFQFQAKAYQSTIGSTWAKKRKNLRIEMHSYLRSPFKVAQHSFTYRMPRFCYFRWQSIFLSPQDLQNAAWSEARISKLQQQRQRSFHATKAFCGWCSGAFWIDLPEIFNPSLRHARAGRQSCKSSSASEKTFGYFRFIWIYFWQTNLFVFS